MHWHGKAVLIATVYDLFNGAEVADKGKERNEEDQGLTASGKILITVTAVNDPPTIDFLGSLPVSINEGGSLNLKGKFNVSDIDYDNDRPVVGRSAKLTVSLNASKGGFMFEGEVPNVLWSLGPPAVEPMGNLFFLHLFQISLRCLIRSHTCHQSWLVLLKCSLKYMIKELWAGGAGVHT